VRRELDAAGARLLGAEHGALVRLHFELPEADAPALLQRLADLSHGAIACSAAGGDAGRATDSS